MPGYNVQWNAGNKRIETKISADNENDRLKTKMKQAIGTTREMCREENRKVPATIFQRSQISSKRKTKTEVKKNTYKSTPTENKQEYLKTKSKEHFENRQIGDEQKSEPKVNPFSIASLVFGVLGVAMVLIAPLIWSNSTPGLVFVSQAMIMGFTLFILFELLSIICRIVAAIEVYNHPELYKRTGVEGIVLGLIVLLLIIMTAINK